MSSCFFFVLSLGNASAAGWTAGPGLTPSDDFPLFKTVERRLGLSTAKIPHSGKEFSIELHVFFNEEMDKAAERYLQALNRESGHRLSGWMDWQAGAVKPYISVVLLETMTYEGGAHPLNYVKGVTLNAAGKVVTLADLKAAMPSLSVETLRDVAVRECTARHISTELAEKIAEFPKEFYIGNDGHLYFIFSNMILHPIRQGGLWRIWDSFLSDSVRKIKKLYDRN